MTDDPKKERERAITAAVDYLRVDAATWSHIPHIQSALLQAANGVRALAPIMENGDDPKWDPGCECQGGTGVCSTCVEDDVSDLDVTLLEGFLQRNVTKEVEVEAKAALKTLIGLLLRRESVLASGEPPRGTMNWYFWEGHRNDTIPKIALVAVPWLLQVWLTERNR